VIFAALSLGPFIRVAGYSTHIPGPWALLRYVPVIGAARMPTRLSILVMMGLSMLLAMCVKHLRSSPTTRRWPAIMTALLICELVPAPRVLYSARVPDVYRLIAADPRPMRVLTLPFGLRDGISSRGNQSAEYQYYQTVHQKPIFGGYISRLPTGQVDRYERLPILRALMDLSEGVVLDDETRRRVIDLAHRRAERLNVGWVVIDTARASDDLIAFAQAAFDLESVASDQNWQLYTSRLEDGR
jgi:hypothetical protein